MIIRYRSCDEVSIVEEKVDKVEFNGIIGTEEVELIYQRSKDNPHYDINDGFGGKFLVPADAVEWIKA